MTSDSLAQTAVVFYSNAEHLHDQFLTIQSDSNCIGCKSSGFGKAILTAWLQARWIDFTHDLLVMSALGVTRNPNPVQPLPRVHSEQDAKKTVRQACRQVASVRGLQLPILHAPWFVVEVGKFLGLHNLPSIQSALGPSLIPDQITDFRNYLVHPGSRTQQKYSNLQAKLGMVRVEPEDLLDQYQSPGVPLFTAWVRELQRIAYAATQ